MNKTINNQGFEKGFTLVELAIVMIIIGLLIGGILKGQELVANARVTATVAQMKGIDAAMSTFQDKYKAIPGDMLNPGARLTNCTGFCAPPEANGNGQVDGDFADSPAMHREVGAFFEQLAAADLVTGVQAASGAVTWSWGDEFPAASIGGGFYAEYFAGGANPAGGFANPASAVRSGHYLALHNNVGGAVSDGPRAITPNQAYRIDAKLDDGSPLTGSVFPAGDAACINVDVYNEVADQNTCNLYIRFHQ